LDRAHIVAYSKIQEWILAYLNGGSQAQLTQRVERTVARASAAERTAALASLEEMLDMVRISPGDFGGIATCANTLLGRLNSIPPNLRAASKYGNRYMSNNLDPQ